MPETERVAILHPNRNPMQRILDQQLLKTIRMYNLKRTRKSTVWGTGGIRTLGICTFLIFAQSNSDHLWRNYGQNHQHFRVLGLDLWPFKVKKQVRQQDAYPKNARGAATTMRRNIAITFAMEKLECYGKTRMVWLPGSEKVWLYIYSFLHNTRTWQTDGQTPHDSIGRAYA